MPSEKKLLKMLKEYTASIERRHRSRSRSRRRRRRTRTPSTSRSPRRARGSRARSRSPVRRERERASPTRSDDGNVIGVQNEGNNEDTVAAENAPTTNVPPANAPTAEEEEVTNPYSEALGEDYVETTKFGDNIHDDISRRWSHILVNGLTKEQRDIITKKYKIPNNCILLEAPTMNIEVKNVLAEASKLRDKSIEIGQAQLGLATAILGQAMTQLMKNEETDNVKYVSMLSDAAKLLNDLHYHQTKTRKKLITPSLDKNFNQSIENTKRNNFLFGDDLSETIKNSKQLQQSVAHIKKIVPANQNISTNKSSGNRNGPPPRPRGRGMTRGGPKRQDFQTSQSFQPYHNQQKRPSSYQNYQHYRRPERSTQGSRSAGRKRY